MSGGLDLESRALGVRDSGSGAFLRVGLLLDFQISRVRDQTTRS